MSTFAYFNCFIVAENSAKDSRRNFYWI